MDRVTVDFGAGEQKVYCGTRRPSMLMSAAERLQLTLRTGGLPSATRGFAVNFAFVTGRQPTDILLRILLLLLLLEEEEEEEEEEQEEEEFILQTCTQN